MNADENLGFCGREGTGQRTAVSLRMAKILFSSVAPGCVGCCAQTNFTALQSLGCDRRCCASNGSSLNLESLLGGVGILSSPDR